MLASRTFGYLNCLAAVRHWPGHTVWTWAPMLLVLTLNHRSMPIPNSMPRSRWSEIVCCSGCSFCRSWSLHGGADGVGNQCCFSKSPRQWFDWEMRGDHNNFLTDTGFLVALRDTLRLRRGALLWGGVPCSSLLDMITWNYSRNTCCSLHAWIDVLLLCGFFQIDHCCAEMGVD